MSMTCLCILQAAQHNVDFNLTMLRMTTLIRL